MKLVLVNKERRRQLRQEQSTLLRGKKHNCNEQEAKQPSARYTKPGARY
ncbi:22264_t:CDS:2 [Dentiscutata erythropus]|uniref:22264_t:CDS:1 n=1 Tax=Dentiscutata erythropus TaxID=1348616 RepID=A0A9N9E2G1_9GLOM|nr:22264_t:CDS:2 [Dentiscutata erythropus]